MDNKYGEQLLIMKYTIEANRQEPDEKLNNITEDSKEIITPTITSIMDKINISK